jgi:hypothetical protein
MTRFTATRASDEHISCGVVPMTRAGAGHLFDWQQVIGGLFTVHHAKEHLPPAARLRHHP